jgi:hypothetical protein
MLNRGPRALVPVMLRGLGNKQDLTPGLLGLLGLLCAALGCPQATAHTRGVSGKPATSFSAEDHVPTFQSSQRRDEGLEDEHDEAAAPERGAVAWSAGPLRARGRHGGGVLCPRGRVCGRLLSLAHPTGRTNGRDLARRPQGSRGAATHPPATSPYTARRGVSAPLGGHDTCTHGS